METNNTQPHAIGFLRLPDVLRLVPVSKSTWWAGIKAGRYPAPVRISSNAVAWKVSDIRELCERLGQKEAA